MAQPAGGGDGAYRGGYGNHCPFACCHTCAHKGFHYPGGVDFLNWEQNEEGTHSVVGWQPNPGEGEVAALLFGP